MGRTDPRYLVVGHIEKPHGTKGELYVRFLTDHPEGSFAPGVVLFMGGPNDDEPDWDLPPMEIEEVRPFRSGVLVFFAGIDDRARADRVRGHYLFRSIDDLEPLEEGEFFYHQLLGLEVHTVAGERIGKVTEVFEMQPADLLQVRGGAREHVIPFLPQLVVEVDIEGGRLVIDPPEGLLEL